MVIIQKQSPEVFHKRAVLKTFLIFTGKTPESLFNKVIKRDFIKQTPTQSFSSEYCKNFKNTYFKNIWEDWF